MAKTKQHQISYSGTFAKLFSQYEHVLRGREIQTERIIDVLARETSFWTSDLGLCSIRDGEVILSITDYKTAGIEPIKFSDWITKKGIKVPSDEIGLLIPFYTNVKLRRSLESIAQEVDGRVVEINLSQLEREGHIQHSSYVEIGIDMVLQGREAVQARYGNTITGLYDAVHGNAIYGPDGLGTRISWVNDPEWNRERTKGVLRVNIPDINEVKKLLDGKNADKMVALGPSSVISVGLWGSTFFLNYHMPDIDFFNVCGVPNKRVDYQRRE